jgi:beta-glucosidase/6-phospho-beta-glucosidase/beta-galactosidase
MEKCGHYKHWRTDFDLVQEMGICFLRYGPPIHRTWLGDGKHDWDFADQTLHDLRERDIVVIADLCHFGVPAWVGNFQNPDLPRLFSNYARAFADRYPWIQAYTPVNEMYVCAMQAIIDARPDAIFVQSESTEYFHAENPNAIKPAEIMNSRRFLSLDLNYGRRVDSEMYEFLMDNGMTRDEYHFFLHNNLKHSCIMGNDYYLLNEHRVAPDGSSRASGEVFGYYGITRQYYDRYQLPVMHTETNFEQGPRGDEAVFWLWKEWANVLRVRNDGVPIVGFTWYSLTDQMDWDTALREDNGHVNPLGLYDLDRKIRPVGEAYKQLIADWRRVLPVQSVCLHVPVVPPNEHDLEWARKR